MLCLLLTFSLFFLMLSYIIFQSNQTLHLLAQECYFIIMIATFVNLIYYLYTSLTKQHFYTTILRCLFLSTLTPIFSGLEHVSNSTRETLSFNNPNQMFFFAVIGMASLFYLTLFSKKENLRVKIGLSLIISNVFLFMVFLSVSRLGVIFLIMYALFYFVLFDFKMKNKSKILFSFCAFFLAIIILWHTLNHFILNYILIRGAKDFSENTLESDTTLRALQGVEYSFSNMFFFIFGTGQTSNPLRALNLEFHNNFLGIFNQSGFFCLSIYVFLNILAMNSLWKKGWIYLVPFFSYFIVSMFHYTFRERINWLFWAIIIFITTYKIFDKNRQIRSQ